MSQTTRRKWMKGSAAAGLGFGLTGTRGLFGAARPELKITRAEAFGLRIPFHARVRENMQ